MSRTITAMVIALAFCLLSTYTTEAAQLQCAPAAFRQQDMAGTYAGDNMRLEIYPCGGSYLVWQNPYGTHESGYSSSLRLPGGGIIARGVAPDPVWGRYLDSAPTIVYKPAEPGYIQVATFDAFDNIIELYRLRKVL